MYVQVSFCMTHRVYANGKYLFWPGNGFDNNNSLLLCVMCVNIITIFTTKIYGLWQIETVPTRISIE